MTDDDRYLENFSADDVRVRGTRVGVEHLLSAYLAGALPEEICVEFPTVTLEQVHGVIAWYLRNRPEVDVYLAERQGEARQSRRQQAQQPQAAVVERLRQLVEARIAE
jgi:uncharacterized protein (DUF433 family)